MTNRTKLSHCTATRVTECARCAWQYELQRRISHSYASDLCANTLLYINDMSSAIFSHRRQINDLIRLQVV